MRLLSSAVLIALLAVSPPGARDVRAEEGARIVSVGGDVTEILYAIGAGDRLIAVDTSSRYPAETRALPDVGYMRALSAEPILALAPDHIIAIEDAGPVGAIDILRQAGVRFTMIPDTPTVEGAIAKIEQTAAAAGLPDAGAALATETRRRVDAAIAKTPKSGRKPRAIFFLSVGRGGLLAGGRGTSADAIINLAGGENVAAAFTGYKPIEPEAMTAGDPEIIIVTDRTVKALGGVDVILTSPQFAGTTAARTGRLVAFDGQMLLGFGPRLGEAIEALTAALHPPRPE